MDDAERTSPTKLGTLTQNEAEMWTVCGWDPILPRISAASGLPHPAVWEPFRFTGNGISAIRIIWSCVATE